MQERGQRVCQACGARLSGDNEYCPVCLLRGALDSGDDAREDLLPLELRFEHYQVLKSEEGTLIELGRGAMGVTYKALDTRLQRSVALKIIAARLIGDQAAQDRFVREARSAASVRHPNVASVFHLGNTGTDYFYAMEFVDGETLERLIRRSGQLNSNLALEIVRQIAAGLGAIHKQHLVHRDIKPGNIMVHLEDGEAESVKIIDLGLAKRVAEEGGVSVTGTFAGTPEYASPEQFVGIGVDIRSDIYSLGIVFWETLSGAVPYQGSSSELIYQHRHSALPLSELTRSPLPIIALLELMLAKNPANRLQTPRCLLAAIKIVGEALSSGRRLTRDELESLIASSDLAQPVNHPSRSIAADLPGKHQPAFRRLIASVLAIVLLFAILSFFHYPRTLVDRSTGRGAPPEKSVAVLPFESLSADKADTYFADGVQDEILNDLAKIAQLKVISRTSVMRYRPAAGRDLRQIAHALGVANVLEGTVRREGNRVRITTELVDARNDDTIWADSYDRDATDIFAIQSEIAQTIAGKLRATLSPEEKKTIEAKPTDNLEAYDLYLRGKALLLNAELSSGFASTREPLLEATDFLTHAVQLDPKFTLAYCASENANDLIYFWFDPTPDRLAKAEAAVQAALGLQPDLPEVHLAYARHLYFGYRDYAGAHAQLALARRGLPNDAEVNYHEALLDRRQGNFNQAIEQLNAAITLDPRNSAYLYQLAVSLRDIRQFKAGEQVLDRVIELQPDEPSLGAEKAYFHYLKEGEVNLGRSWIATLPPSFANTTAGLTLRLSLALVDRDWAQAAELIAQFKGGDDNDGFAYGGRPVPVECYSVLLSRLQEEDPSAAFAAVREQLNQRVLKSPQDAPRLSQLAVLDALLGRKEIALAEAKRASEMLPVSKDALEGPSMLKNLAVVYAWTNELDPAFSTLEPLTRKPAGIYYGELKRDPYWEPLRQDSRYDKLLTELAPKE